eukprot:jgi/Tetstr1/456255/TSEL_043016.t1
MGGELRTTLRRWAHYWRYDFRDIVAPRGLPARPGEQEARRPTWGELWQAVREGTEDYMDTWRSRPQEAEAEAGPASGESSSGGQAPGGGGSSLLGEIRDEFAAVAKGGARGAAPYLQKLAQMRGEMLKDSLQAFTDGYKDGLKQEAQPQPQPPGQAGHGAGPSQPGRASPGAH